MSETTKGQNQTTKPGRLWFESKKGAQISISMPTGTVRAATSKRQRLESGRRASARVAPQRTDVGNLRRQNPRRAVQRENLRAMPAGLNDDNAGESTPRETIEGGYAVDFETWIRRVDAFVWLRAGVSVHDLPDCPFRIWFDDEVTPEGAARAAIRRAH